MTSLQLIWSVSDLQQTFQFMVLVQSLCSRAQTGFKELLHAWKCGCEHLMTLSAYRVKVSSNPTRWPTEPLWTATLILQGCRRFTGCLPTLLLCGCIREQLFDAFSVVLLTTYEWESSKRDGKMFLCGWRKNAKWNDLWRNDHHTLECCLCPPEEPLSSVHSGLFLSFHLCEDQVLRPGEWGHFLE